jgi:hypothetical protein
MTCGECLHRRQAVSCHSVKPAVRRMPLYPLTPLSGHDLVSHSEIAALRAAESIGFMRRATWAAAKERLDWDWE